jgi:hypothetical protein
LLSPVFLISTRFTSNSVGWWSGNVMAYGGGGG